MMKGGTMSVTETKEFNPIQESSPTEGQDESSSFVNMQIELHNKGTVLTKAWSDLFSFITKYQAELVMRENSVEIAEKEIKERKKQLEELAGSGNDETLQDVIYTKERKLRKSQSELDVKDRMLQKVQSDLSSHMELLEKSQCDLLKKQSDLVRYRGNVEQLKSELNVKEEQIKIKDTLLKKLQNQLMKENAELKEQLELERQALLLERQSHGSTKGTMSSPGPNTRKRARTNADSATVIDIPASPPTLDLSEDQNFGLSSIISMTESQTESSEPGRRVSSRLKKSVASASQLSTDHSSRLCQRPTAIASSEVSYTTPQKDAQYMASPPISDSTAATSDTYFPLSVSDDTKLLDISSIKVDNGIQDEAPPATVHVSPCSGASDNEGDGTVSEVVQSPEGSTDTKNADTGLLLDCEDVPQKSVGKTKERKGHFICKFCGNVYSLMSSLKRHERVHTGTGNTCDICQKQYPESYELKRHIARVHDKIRYPCPKCHKQYCSEASLQKHLDDHKKIFRFKCTKCDRGYNNKLSFDNHMDRHNGIKRHLCPSCGKLFVQVADRDRHYDKCGNLVAPLQCNICDKTFRNIRYLREHENYHANPTALKCKFCEKTFQYSGNLYIHRKTCKKKTE